MKNRINNPLIALAIFAGIKHATAQGAAFTCHADSPAIRMVTKTFNPALL